MPKNKPKPPTRRDAEFARDMLEAKKGQEEFRKDVGRIKEGVKKWRLNLQKKQDDLKKRDPRYQT
jgi:hypothetical protein